MAKQVLNEQVTSVKSLKLVESVTKRSGCLGTISGICADYKNATRNGNFYSRKLWENVFKNPLTKEALEDRVLFGELDHPQDGRLETCLSNACMVMTGYEFDDKDQVVRGSFDILDTPSGRILKSLLDYGCVCGVSSRGEGDVTEDSQGRNVVAEDGSYYFVAFDAVAMPAVQSAKPSLQESLQETTQKRLTLKESLVNEITNATTKNELELIKKVLEATELPDVDSLLESINNKSKELEGSNNSSALIEDLERSTALSNTLTEENKELKQEVADCKSRIKRFVESHLKQSSENSKLQEELDKLTGDYNDIVFKLNQSNKRLESMKSRLNETSGKVKELEESLKDVNSKNSEYESKIASLEESLERSQKVCRDRSSRIKDLTEELRKTKSDFEDELRESRSRESEVRSRIKETKSSLKESQSSNKKLLTTYASQRAKDLGIDPKDLLESLKPGMTTVDIDKLLQEEVDRKDRYQQMPMTRDPLVESLAKSGRTTVSVNTMKPNEEEVQTRSFMESFYKINK